MLQNVWKYNFKIAKLAWKEQREHSESYFTSICVKSQLELASFERSSGPPQRTDNSRLTQGCQMAVATAIFQKCSRRKFFLPVANWWP
jgi:hypothetical protein